MTKSWIVKVRPAISVCDPGTSSHDNWMADVTYGLIRASMTFKYNTPGRLAVLLYRFLGPIAPVAVPGKVRKIST